jgi:hypothetical protein
MNCANRQGQRQHVTCLGFAAAGTTLNFRRYIDARGMLGYRCCQIASVQEKQEQSVVQKYTRVHQKRLLLLAAAAWRCCWR